MAEPIQNYKNHTKFVPLFHFVAFPILALNFFWQVRYFIQQPRPGTAVAAATAFALILVCFLARVFALKAQDRVIRLEMRMKLRELLPASMHARIGEFTSGQLVALRFASDAELPELAQKVLTDGIVDQKAIKLMIKNWNPDHHRL